MVNVVALATQLKRAAKTNKIRECVIHDKKNNIQEHTYNTFHINRIYFTFIRSFILPIGRTKMSLTIAKIVQIIVTPRALPTISFTYIEKYVSVHNHRHIINNTKDQDIDLIFTGTISLKFLSIHFSFFSMFSSY